jgi:prepilin-type N-terminal cleavage/methylation domain-containing protein
MKNKFQKKAGFTLVEVLIAAFIITVGVVASYMMIQQIFAQTFEASTRLTAIYLAKEGAEIARNIRDTGWLQDLDWNNNGLAAGNYQASYNGYSLISCPGSCEFGNMYFVNYITGTSTHFKRRINIQRPSSGQNAGAIIVTVDVMWQDKGQVKKVTIQSLLYDWKI